MTDGNQKALIAMSGGVDSAVAAYLMQKQGYDCIGTTMKLFDNAAAGLSAEKTCCSLEDMEDARAVADRLGIPHTVFNFIPDFKAQIIDRFAEAYVHGATPNPCIDCNRYMKFQKLLFRARQMGIDYLVTGHYARIEQDPASGRYLLKKAVDETKDQSYVLYFMTQEQLAHTRFPLGGLRKQEVRHIAEQQGFTNAKKRDSQDICFVRDGDYAGFIERYTGKNYAAGDFIDTEGTVLGRHKGLIRYTVGQRKGLGLPLPKPMYVCEKNERDNTITLCEHDALFAESLDAVDFNWIAHEDSEKPLRVQAKIRYAHSPQWAVATKTSPDAVRVVFETPQRAIARGQAVVLYDGDVVVGGGTIA